jgi:hypothetical protein
MATRSCIGVRVGTAKKPRYVAVYCHYDGYTSHQMPLLLAHHDSHEAAQELVAGGDISALHTNLGWDRETLPQSGPLYYADRGEVPAVVAPKEFTDIQALLDHFQECGCEHAYVFVPGQSWVHTDLRQLDLPFEPAPTDFNYVGSPSHY